MCGVFTLDVQRLLFFLPDADVVDFHRERQSCLVDALIAAPVAAPSHVEDRVEGFVEGPCVVVALMVVFEVELLLPVHVSSNVILCPFQSVNVETVLSSFAVEVVRLLRLCRVIVGGTMDAAGNVVGINAYLKLH